MNDYEMPGLISAETAAAEILKGLRTDSFIIQFPKHFTRKMGLLRWLPDRTFSSWSGRVPVIHSPERPHRRTRRHDAT